MENLDNRLYNWQILEASGQYIPCNTLENPIIVKREYFEDFLQVFKDSFFNDFIRRYDFFTIHKTSRNSIDNLLEHYKFSNLNQNFYTLAAVLQCEYIYYITHPFTKEDIQNFGIDIETEYKDTEQMLDLLHFYLDDKVNAKEKTVLNKLHSIDFKFKEKPHLKFENSFVFTTILNSLIKEYSLTLENFTERKNQILSNISNIPLNNIAEIHKLNIIKGLYELISKYGDKSIIENQKYKFIAIFLHVCQIPVNSKSNEIILTKNIKELVTSNDIKNIRHYIKDRNKFFLRN